jgi:hypothetical protein
MWNGHQLPKDTFINRPPTQKQGETYDRVTSTFNEIGSILTTLLPPSRYASLCLTAIEEACMWAKKCVAFEVDQVQSSTPNITADKIVSHAFSGHNLHPGPCGVCGEPWEAHAILPR